MTYAEAAGVQHAGALIDPDQAVPGLQDAQRELHGGNITGESIGWAARSTASWSAKC